MARTARLAIAGYPHHVIQRGNDRQAVFREDEDRRRYLSMLGEGLKEQAVVLHAYVLMDNHVHLLLTPGDGAALSRLMQRLGTWYAGWFNHRHGRTGALWEGRFRSSPIDSDAYLLACMRYIERNPVRAGMVQQAEDYPWSSARHHLGLEVNPLVTDHGLFWALGNTPFEREAAYRRLVQEPPPDESVRFGRLLGLGKPLGDAPFLERIGRETGRPLGPGRRGRPPSRKPVPI